MSVPYEIVMRKIDRSGFDSFELEASATLKVARRRLQERVKNHVDEYDWVGVKRGERVLLRGTRVEDAWKWETVDLHVNEPEPTELF